MDFIIVIFKTVILFWLWDEFQGEKQYLRNNRTIGKIRMMVLPETLYKNRQILNRISIYSSKDKVLSFPQRKYFNILSLPPGLWLVTLGNGTPSGDHYLSLLFAYPILSSRCDQLRLAEWQFILLSTCIIPISATLFMGPLSNDRNDWAKRPTVYRMGHPVYLITGLLLWWCYPLMSIYKNTNIFIFITHLGRSMCILFLWCLSHQFSNNVLSKSLVIQASSLQSINQWGKKHTDLGISASIQNV